ncbi:MAG: helix-turn-helix transcriptional regulator [Propionibacteriaceae bacterium]|nr:helix-turn-helix transcriptional regulator [Propionibacteriaceae bacterium]
MTGSLFRVLREGMGLSQQDLAGLFGVQKRAVQRWEGGDREIPTSRGEELLQLFQHFEEVVAHHVEQAHASGGLVVVGVLDDEGEMPAGWQRAVAFAVVRATPRVVVADTTLETGGAG